MYVSFSKLPDHARIWVYQADQPLTSEQQVVISESAAEFLDQWAAHGAPLTASFRISHDRFLIIGVNEAVNSVSGCSTDAQFRFVQELQQEIGVNFFDRTLVALSSGDEVSLVRLNDLKQKSVPVGEETMTFNNLVSAKGQLDSEWIQPLAQSWLARFI